ncbi:uncharacterized protein TNCV_3007991 [Trichonephila clavipes]|nr:uncharacterized protein TNCV_3007991 [Trichonephila clavipes]
MPLQVNSQQLHQEKKHGQHLLMNKYTDFPEFRFLSMDVCIYDFASLQHRSTDTYENWHVYKLFCGEGFVLSSLLQLSPSGTTAYQLLHRSINRQVANMAPKMMPTFCYASIDRHYNGLHRNVGASRFNGPYGRQGCVLVRTVESNQGGRFDGNESVADSFRSGAVSFKTHVHAISRRFFPLTSARKTSRLESELPARGQPLVHSFPLR